MPAIRCLLLSITVAVCIASTGGQVGSAFASANASASLKLVPERMLVREFTPRPAVAKRMTKAKSRGKEKVDTVTPVALPRETKRKASEAFPSIADPDRPGRYCNELADTMRPPARSVINRLVKDDCSLGIHCLLNQNDAELKKFGMDIIQREAEQGNGKAQMIFAMVTLRGVTGIKPKSVITGLHYLYLSIDNPEASLKWKTHVALALIHGDHPMIPPNKQRGLMVLYEAAEGGSVDACMIMSRSCMRLWSQTGKDRARQVAMKFFAKAASLGNEEAANELWVENVFV